VSRGCDRGARPSQPGRVHEPPLPQKKARARMYRPSRSEASASVRATESDRGGLFSTEEKWGGGVAG